MSVLKINRSKSRLEVIIFAVFLRDKLIDFILLSVKVISGEIPYENAESTFKSWMGSFYKLLTKTQRKNMVSLFEGLFNRKITIRKKKMIINEV